MEEEKAVVWWATHREVDLLTLSFADAPRRTGTLP